MQNTKLTQQSEDKIAFIDSVAKEAGSLILSEHTGIKQSATMAMALVKMEQALDDQFVSEFIAPLAGKKLGFRTDKDTKGGYDLRTIKDCFIDASLRGVPAVGNCFNIIASNMYVTKEGFWHLFKNQLTHVKNLKLNLPVPAMKNGGAIVDASATWEINQVSDSLSASIPIKVNNHMGTDAILGKSERKLLARVYAQITGSNLGEGDTDDSDAPMRDATPKRKTEVNPFQQPEEAPPAPEKPAPVNRNIPSNREQATEPAPTKGETFPVLITGVFDKLTSRQKPYWMVKFQAGDQPYEASTFSSTVSEKAKGLINSDANVTVERKEVEGDNGQKRVYLNLLTIEEADLV